MLQEFVFVVLVNGEDFDARFWDYSREAAEAEMARCIKNHTILDHIW